MSNEAMNYVRALKVGNRGRKYLLTLLADHADEQFSCHPSIPFLASICEVSDRMVQMDIRCLREQGFLSDRECFRSNGSQTSNRYFLHGPWDDYGGTGEPFARVALPERIQINERPFREGTRAAGGVKPASSPPVKSASPGGMKSASPGERNRLHPEGVTHFTPGVLPVSPLGVSPTSPLEPPDEPTEEPKSPSSAVEVTVPGARAEDGRRETEVSARDEERERARDLLRRVPAPGSLTPLTPGTTEELVPLVLPFLAEPFRWERWDLLARLEHGLPESGSLYAVLRHRLTVQLNSARLPDELPLWEHEQRRRPARPAPLVDCSECQQPMPGGSPDGLCARCRAEMQAATAGLVDVDQADEDAAVARQGRAAERMRRALLGEDLVLADAGQLPGQLGVPLPDESEAS